MHWATHGIGGIVGIALGYWLLGTCVQSSAVPCTEVLHCHCMNAFGSPPWSAEAAVGLGGAVGVMAVEAYRFLSERFGS